MTIVLSALDAIMRNDFASTATPFLARTALLMVAMVPVAAALMYGTQSGRRLASPAVVRQAAANDCGPAALKMIFDRHGVSATIEKIYAAAGTTDAGTTVTGLVRAARASGLHAEGWMLSATDLRRAPMPAIAHIDDDHYVVIRSVTADEVVFDDPGYGRVVLTRRAFARRWRGATVLFGRAQPLFVTKSPLSVSEKEKT